MSIVDCSHVQRRVSIVVTQVDFCFGFQKQSDVVDWCASGCSLHTNGGNVQRRVPIVVSLIGSRLRLQQQLYCALLNMPGRFAEGRSPAVPDLVDPVRRVLDDQFEGV